MEHAAQLLGDLGITGRVVLDVRLLAAGEPIGELVGHPAYERLQGIGF
jgi:hypothetical protein